MEGSVGYFAPAVTPLEDLEDQITELAKHIAAATYRFLALIREFDERGGWGGDGLRTCAHWLNWRCGIDLGAAREKLRVAHALPVLPLISAAFSRGEISYSKVRAMTRVATAANEEILLNVALHGTAHHVERLARAYRRTLRLEDANRQHAERHLSCYQDEDGCFVIRARLPAEQGALVMQALEAAVESVREREQEVGAEAPPTEEEPAAARRADALALLAETFIARGPADLAGGERNQVVVHVSAATFLADRHELGEGENVSAETCRRIACDCSLVHVDEDSNGEPLDVGRKTRSIPPSIRRALHHRDKGCRFPGCTCTRYVDGHHVRHWADGGETKLSNLVLLCRYHHRLVHEGGFTIRVLDDGALRFLRPERQHVPLSGASEDVLFADWRKLENEHERLGLGITPRTIESRWLGERMDYDIAIDELMRRASARA